MGYDYDIRLEHRFTKMIKAILGNYFIEQDAQHDRQEGTDFEIFTVTPFKIGVRLRRHRYFLRYPREFTLRWSRPSGVKTEIDKVREGLVDYILYGFINEKETKIIQYFIGDLGIFREHEPKPLAIYANTPPDSRLAVFAIEQLPPEFVGKFWPTYL